jgi:DNA invertase Pin-like site-specific DNA recombinase
LKLLEKGDTLLAVRLDRLGRSMRDLANIAYEIQSKGAALKVIEQPVDTSTIAGRTFFGMLSTFAEFETDVCRERQAEGIARAKNNRERRKDGKLKYAGRAPSVDRDAVRKAIAAGRKPAEVAREMGISRMSVW